ncbi:MAG: T9SS type A sorting domain-containing protein [Chitinophagaceae bacterium]
MKQIFTLFTASLLLLSPKANAQVVLNELYTDPGSGNHEFFELYNTSPGAGGFSTENLTLITFFVISGQKGFYVMDMPNMTVAPRGFFVGSAALPFNYQGVTGSNASDFSWNSASFIANNGFIKKWVQGTANLVDGNLFYDLATLPANFNDFFFRRTAYGASYTVFLYNNGQLINTFLGGTGGNATIINDIVNMPTLYVDMSSTSPDFTINFSSYSSLPLESIAQDAGSDNGFIREADGICAGWVKSSAQVQHTPKVTNGSASGTTGSVAVSAAISRGNATIGSIVNYDIVSAPSSYFPIELQVYTDLGSSMGKLDAGDIWVESNTETVISQGPFYTRFYPYNANIMIAVKTSAGCLDKTLFIPNSLVLSVKLVDFEGKQVDNTIQLKWEVESNETANRFEVLKSSNGQDFTVAANVFATEKSGRESYSFNAPAPVSGKIVYQLRIYNKDGKIDHSKTLVFESKNVSKKILTLINNPVIDRLMIRFEAAANQSMEFSIVDMTGRLVQQGKINTYKGTNEVNLPLTSGLKNGTYIVNLFDGTQYHTNKFVKQ